MSLSPDQDLNLGYPEYEAWVLRTGCSVSDVKQNSKKNEQYVEKSAVIMKKELGEEKMKERGKENERVQRQRELKIKFAAQDS